MWTVLAAVLLTAACGGSSDPDPESSAQGATTAASDSAGAGEPSSEPTETTEAAPVPSTTAAPEVEPFSLIGTGTVGGHYEIYTSGSLAVVGSWTHDATSFELPLGSAAQGEALVLPPVGDVCQAQSDGFACTRRLLGTDTDSHCLVIERETGEIVCQRLPGEGPGDGAPGDLVWNVTGICPDGVADMVQGVPNCLSDLPMTADGVRWVPGFAGGEPRLYRIDPASGAVDCVAVLVDGLPQSITADPAGGIVTTSRSLSRPGEVVDVAVGDDCSVGDRAYRPGSLGSGAVVRVEGTWFLTTVDSDETDGEGFPLRLAALRDPGGNTHILSDLPLGGPPSPQRLVEAARALWATVQTDGTAFLVRIDPTNPSEPEIVAEGVWFTALAATDDAVLVGDSDRGTIEAIATS